MKTERSQVVGRTMMISGVLGGGPFDTYIVLFLNSNGDD